MSERKKILVVDDDKTVSDLVARVVEEVGYEVYVAGDGLEGYEKAKEVCPDLVVTDLSMPRMNGLELCRKLKSDDYPHDVKVLIITGNHDFAPEEDEAEDHMTKPFSLVDLLNKTKELLSE